MRRDGFHEVGAAHLEDAIDEVIEFAGRGQGQMPFEDHAIKAVQGAENQAGELDQKVANRGHGILSRLVELSTNHSAG
ncbi:MAG: hypothetical protein JNM56_17400 [Planctomycetia bacterium]|nr:hypothetical protein [Planctomycetia bacterium]